MHVRLKTSYRAPAERAKGFLPVHVSTGMNHQGATVWVFEIYYRRLLIGLSLAAVIGYFASVTALYVWLARKPHNQVSWPDLAAPWRWSGLQAKRGDAAILTALDELKAANYGSAFYYLRLGLGRSPGNAVGRITLARLLLGHDPVRAVNLLEEGIPVALADDEFLPALLAAYRGQQIQEHALKTLERVAQAQAALSPANRLRLAVGRCELLLALARTEEIAAAVAAVRALDAAEGARWECAWRLQARQWPEARQIFEAELAERLGEPDIRPLAIELAVGTGDAELLQRALRRLRAAAPEAPATYLAGFRAWHRMKRATYRDAAEQEFYQLFATHESALQSLAALAVALDLPEVIDHARAAAVAGGFRPFAFDVHQTELLVRRRQLDEAMTRLPAWENLIATLPVAQRFHPEFVLRLTRAAFTGEADQLAALVAHLAANRGRTLLGVYQLAATVLEEAGQPAAAEEVLRTGLVFFPLSDPLLTPQRRLAAVLAEQKAGAAPTRSKAVGGVVLPATAAIAQQRIDALLAANALVETRDLLKALRTQPPAWWPPVESWMAQREVELACLTLDPLASRGVARAYLGRFRDEQEQLGLVAVAGRLTGRERWAEARALIREIEEVAAANPRVRLAISELRLPEQATAVPMATAAEALAAIDGLLAGRAWEEAERQLKQWREKPPAWAAGADMELKVREVRIRLGLDQRPLALAAMKDLVIKGGLARAAAFRVTRELLANGEEETARVLAREINRLLPGDPAAQRLLRETETPPGVTD